MAFKSIISTLGSGEVNSVTGTANQVLVNGTSGTPEGGNVTLSLAPAVSGVDTITLNSGGALQTDTTTGHTIKLNLYDVDGATYKTFLTGTNGNTPTLNIAAPSGGGLFLGGALLNANCKLGSDFSLQDFDINTGTMNNVVIGGTTPVAATFTTANIITNTVYTDGSVIYSSVYPGASQTTDATPTILFSLGIAAGEGRTATGTITGTISDGSKIICVVLNQVGIKRPTAGNVALSDAISITSAPDSGFTASVAITAATGTQSLVATVTGVAATIINWNYNITLT